MASPKIRIKRTAVPGKFPTVEQLDLGELAINTFEGKLFLKQNQNGTESIVDVGSLSALFPTGDYNAGSDPTDPLENTVDAFGVLTIAFWDMMGPEGRIYQVDLETNV